MELWGGDGGGAWVARAAGGGGGGVEGERKTRTRLCLPHHQDGPIDQNETTENDGEER